MSLIILNFHGVGPILRPLDYGEYNCWLDGDAFSAVLDLVSKQPQVRLTVDDGNSSDHEIILPELLRRGLRATFFICAGRLDQPNFLSRAQVRELQAHGMSVGSHGVDHLPWRGLPAKQLRRETAESRYILQKLCRAPIDTAACPFGSYDRRVLTALEQAGYRAVYTSDGGKAVDSQWLRARTTVTRSMTLSEIDGLARHGRGKLRQSLITFRALVKRLRA